MKNMLTNEELEDLVKSSINECEEIEIESAMWTPEKFFSKCFGWHKHPRKKIMDYERMKKRSIKVTRIITEALQLLQQMFNKLKRPMQQLLITMSSTKWKKNCPRSKTLSHQHNLHLKSSSHHRSNCGIIISPPSSSSSSVIIAATRRMEKSNSTGNRLRYI